MIPKIIHYCWFGRGDMPAAALKCIESWKKILPDYELYLWNEDNFDIQSNKYVREAYEARKFAFVTDYVRLYALLNYGGIYMDTDVEVLKSLGPFLHHSAFSGFEDHGFVPTGIMGSIKGGEWVSDLLDYYNDRSFVNKDGTYDTTTNTYTITQNALRKGFLMNNEFQEIDNYVVFYESEYFCPKSHGTGELTVTDKTVCIHHFAGSWLPLEKRILTKLKIKLMKLFGVENINKFISVLKLQEIKEFFLNK